MADIDFVTLDVFTRTKYEGNPLAVVLPSSMSSSGLTPERRSQIAKEFNLSETVFLYLDEKSGEDQTGEPKWRIEIYLATGRQIPFAGHPTIGAAYYAIMQYAGRNEMIEGQAFEIECPAGIISAKMNANGLVEVDVPHNVHLHDQHPVGVDYILSLQPGLTAAEIVKPPLVASPVKGMNFILVCLSSLDALGKITLGKKPTAQLDESWDEGFVGSSYYHIIDERTEVVDSGLERKVLRIRTRMIEGGFEDPATGSAACALASAIALERRESVRFEIEQGVEMGRRSDIGVMITLTEDGKAAKHVQLSGTAVQVMKGSLRV